MSRPLDTRLNVNGGRGLEVQNLAGAHVIVDLLERLARLDAEIGRLRGGS